MRIRRGVLVSSALVALACTAEPRAVSVVLELPVALGCRPTDVDRVEVMALGDFPASSGNVVALDLDEMAFDPVDRFPDDTRLLVVEARGSIGAEPWIGGGIAPLGEGTEALRVPLLRYGRACPMADPSARVPEGAAVVALPDGRVWIAGGHERDAVLPSIVTMHPGDTLAVPSAVRLFVDRTEACASLVDGDLIVLSGGSGAVDGAGEDTFEIVRISSDERVGDGFLVAPRREHAAIARGRRVLLSGGRATAGGAPLGSVEALSVDETGAGGTSVAMGELAVARAGHVMLALDDGSVAIAAGVDAAGEPVAIVERFDPVTETLEVRGAFETARADAAYVALPGARVAQIGGREGGAWTGDVDILLEGGQAVHLEDAVPALDRPVAAAAGARVLVIGRDVGSGRARGVLLDPDGAGAPVDVDAARAASAIVRLADGSFAVGDPLGLSVLRLDLAAALEPPPASIAPAFVEDRERLALDAPARWRARAGVLEAAVAGARFDVPALRFADASVTLDAVGAIELLLVRDDRPPVVVTLGQDGASLGDCRIARADAPVRVIRRGDRLTLDGGAGTIDCAVELPERIGVAVRAREQGAGVRRLELERL